MLGGIGFGLPFSFLGTALVLTVFAVVLVIIISLKDIIEAQDVIW